MSILLEINNLKYKALFNTLNFIIKNHKITTISGSNNCGKTTLIKILERLINTNKCIKLNNTYIEEYTYNDYNLLVQEVIPEISFFRENNLFNELKYYSDDIEKINNLLKEFKCIKMSKKHISKLNKKEKFLCQIIISIIKAKSLVIIDNIDYYFNTKELKEIYKIFHKCIEKYNLTFIITCLNLESTIYTDELYIIHNGDIKLHGKPIEVLEKDNILNKIGLEIPFIIDLSVKLKDYNLIDSTKLNYNDMIDTLWK